MNSCDQPFVSVVTAAYNEERYIRQCIESVLAQDYENWEYIISDNCSTDRTLDIALAYAAQDSRIRVYHNNRLISGRANMNLAVSKIAANSRYCKVVGADDWIFPTCISQMVGIAEAHPNISMVGAYWLSGRDSGPADPAPLGIPHGVTVLTGQQMCWSFLMGGHYQFGTPTSLLYRSDIVRSRAHFFEEALESADVEICLEFLYLRDFGFVPQILSFNRERENSAYDLAKKRGEEFHRDLVLLQRFGNRYLTQEEVKLRTRQVFQRYYQYLGSRVCSKIGHEFWDFHFDNMRAVGYPVSRFRLAQNALIYGIKAAARRLRRAMPSVVEAK